MEDSGKTKRGVVDRNGFSPGKEKKGEERKHVLEWDSVGLARRTPSTTTELTEKDDWKVMKRDPEDLMSVVRSCSQNSQGRGDRRHNPPVEAAPAGKDEQRNDRIDLTVPPSQKTICNTTTTDGTRAASEEGNQEKVTDNSVSDCDALNREILVMKRQRITYENNQSVMALSNKSLMRTISYGTATQSFSKPRVCSEQAVLPRGAPTPTPAPSVAPENRSRNHVEYLLQTQIIELQKREKHLLQKKHEKQHLDDMIKEKQKIYDYILHNQQQAQKQQLEMAKKIHGGERKEMTATVVAPKWLNLEWTNNRQRYEPQMTLPRVDQRLTVGLEYDLYLKLEEDVTQYFETHDKDPSGGEMELRRSKLKTTSG